jgi:hypothetical protein
MIFVGGAEVEQVGKTDPKNRLTPLPHHLTPKGVVRWCGEWSDQACD